RRLEELGMSAEVVATTTEHARVLPLPEGLFDVEDLEGGLPVPKQNLAVLLEPDSPWRGQVLVLASSSLFEDGIFQEDGFAHRVFLRTLLRTFEDRSRLVRNRVERPMPPPLPALGDGARLLWRGAVVLSVPVLLLIGLAVRGRRRGGAVRGDVTVSAIWRAGSQVLVAGGVALVLLLMLAHYLSPLAAVRLDLTADRLHTPAPATLAALAAAERPGGATAVPAPASRAAASDGLRVVLVASPRATLPPELKPIEPRVRRLLRDAGIETSVRRPSTLAAGEPEALARLGLGPFQIQTVVGDSLVPRTVWCGLLLERGARRSVVPHLDGRTVRHLEFLLAAAALRLRDGRAPRVAVLSDLPRLSPAEAYEDYQKQGLIAPAGTDVYSRLRRLLADYGYRVIHLDPREPVLPDDVDVLVWMQPRRDASAPRRLLAGHLAAGGRALVALQHFNIQQRQYRGAGFETVYWPQPQFQDLDLYLRQLGVEQVREVLMDRTRADLELETEVRRTAVREYDPQQVALPFLIRAVGTDYAAGSTITRNLGDLLFIWGNRFALDRERLAALDLEATILVTTSPTAWSYDWHGGWLPPEVFEPGDSLLGRCPLVVRLRGRFPPVVPRTAASGPDDLELRTAVPDGDASAPRGDLVLVGCSEMFKNAHLERAGFAHDQLLLNTVATLALPTELAALMNRHPVVRGFPRRSPSTVLGWRLAVVAGGPLALGLLGLGRWRRGRRPPSVAAPRAAPRSAAASTVGDAGRPRGAS
ncbi:MAG: Gldg family protein, partial [Candidatus Eiseniibacteriota bacterium]